MLRGFSLAYPFYFVIMALYMPTFTTAAPPPIFTKWRDARLNFAIFSIFANLLFGSAAPLYHGKSSYTQFG